VRVIPINGNTKATCHNVTTHGTCVIFSLLLILWWTYAWKMSHGFIWHKKMKLKIKIKYKKLSNNNYRIVIKICNFKIQILSLRLYSKNNLLNSLKINFLICKCFRVTTMAPLTLSSLCVKVFIKCVENGNMGLTEFFWFGMWWFGLLCVRNDKIFSAKDVKVEELFDKIQISL
jgi:hypothetical protein